MRLVAKERLTIGDCRTPVTLRSRSRLQYHVHVACRNSCASPLQVYPCSPKAKLASPLYLASEICRKILESGRGTCCSEERACKPSVCTVRETPYLQLLGKIQDTKGLRTAGDKSVPIQVDVLASIGVLVIAFCGLDFALSAGFRHFAESTARPLERSGGLLFDGSAIVS